jgi:small-conductance mechanosensitive channel
MSAEDQLRDIDTVDFTPWPRPVPLHVLNAVKKLLLVAAILVGVHQLFPATTLGSSLSSTFTLLVVMSWLGPLVRILAARPWGRKAAEE